MHFNTGNGTAHAKFSVRLFIKSLKLHLAAFLVDAVPPLPSLGLLRREENSKIHWDDDKMVLYNPERHLVVVCITFVDGPMLAPAGEWRQPKETCKQRVIDTVFRSVEAQTQWDFLEVSTRIMTLLRWGDPCTMTFCIRTPQDFPLRPKKQYKSVNNASGRPTQDNTSVPRDLDPLSSPNTKEDKETSAQTLPIKAKLRRRMNKDKTKDCTERLGGSSCNILIHFPNDPDCKIFQAAKPQRSSIPTLGQPEPDSLPKPTKWLDCVTADHKILNDHHVSLVYQTTVL